jgi:hypothetical protein
MNIFFTSLDPREAALALDNKRLNKMILETAQLLSNATRQYGSNLSQEAMVAHGFDKLYKQTHNNHPSSVWAREAPQNYLWLVSHFYHLAQEKYARDMQTKPATATLHLSYQKLYPLFAMCTHNLAHMHAIVGAVTLTEADIAKAIAVDQDLKHLPPVEAYRKHMARKWLGDTNPSWGHRQPPQWYTDLTN